MPLISRPPWVVIGAYRNVPLPLRPIPPYKKSKKWPPVYLSKRAPTNINTDASTATATANPNSPSDGGAR
jgi:hypothetical protein